MIGLIYHGVECQTIAIYNTIYQFLQDYRSDTLNIFLYIGILSICNSIILFVLNPSFKNFPRSQLNMRVIDVCIYLACIILLRRYTHFCYLIITVHEIDKQTGIGILLCGFYKGINRETVSCE